MEKHEYREALYLASNEAENALGKGNNDLHDKLYNIYLLCDYIVNNDNDTSLFPTEKTLGYTPSEDWNIIMNVNLLGIDDPYIQKEGQALLSFCQADYLIRSNDLFSGYSKEYDIQSANLDIQYVTSLRSVVDSIDADSVSDEQIRDRVVCLQRNIPYIDTLFSKLCFSFVDLQEYNKWLEEIEVRLSFDAENFALSKYTGVVNNEIAAIKWQNENIIYWKILDTLAENEALVKSDYYNEKDYPSDGMNAWFNKYNNELLNEIDNIKQRCNELIDKWGEDAVLILTGSKTEHYLKLEIISVETARIFNSFDFVSSYFNINQTFVNLLYVTSSEKSDNIVNILNLNFKEETKEAPSNEPDINRDSDITTSIPTITPDEPSSEPTPEPPKGRLISQIEFSTEPYVKRGDRFLKIDELETDAIAYSENANKPEALFGFFDAEGFNSSWNKLYWVHNWEIHFSSDISAYIIDSETDQLVFYNDENPHTNPNANSKSFMDFYKCTITPQYISKERFVYEYYDKKELHDRYIISDGAKVNVNELLNNDELLPENTPEKYIVGKSGYADGNPYSWKGYYFKGDKDESITFKYRDGTINKTVELTAEYRLLECNEKQEITEMGLTDDDYGVFDMSHLDKGLYRVELHTTEYVDGGLNRQWRYIYVIIK